MASLYNRGLLSVLTSTARVVPALDAHLDWLLISLQGSEE